MIRRISSILAVVIVLTLIIPLTTLAASQTTLEKFEVLKALKIMNGIGDGSAALDKSMDRAQLAAILVRIFKLAPVTSDQGFTDVSRNHWAQKEGVIGAVVKAGYMQGTGTNPKTFSPDKNLTYAEVAVVLARVFGLKLDGKMDGAPAWAAAEIKAVVDAGLMTKKSNYNATATRADLVEAAYEMYVRSQNAGDLAVTSVKVSDPKTLTVNFNRAVLDTTKLKATVKRGTINVSLTPKFNNARSELTLESSAKLIAGEYTITLQYNTTILGTYYITVENEKIAEVNFLSNTLMRIDEIKGVASVEIKNQYGQNINDSILARSLQWQATPSTTIDTSRLADGQLYITYGTKTNTTAGSQLKDISKVVVIAINASTGGVFTKELQVSTTTGVVDSIKLGSLRDKDGKVVDVARAVLGAEYTLDFTARDASGNLVTSYDLITSGAIQLVNSNPTSITIDWVKGKNNTAELRLRVLSTAEQTAVITAIAIQTGQHDAKVINIKGDAQLAKFILHGTLTEAIAGEKVELSFSAYDSDGKAVTQYTDIKGKVSFTTLDATISEEMGRNGTYRLFVTFKNSGPQFLLALVGNEHSNLQIYVNPAVEYHAIALAVEKSKTIIAGESQNLSVKLFDQYGREKAYTGSIANYKVDVFSSDTDFTITRNTDGTFKISTTKNKSANVVVSAYLTDSKNNIIDVVTTTITYVSSDDVVNFTLTGADKLIYASGKLDNYSTKIDVTGRLANGTSVYLGSKSVDFIKAITLSNTDAFKQGTSNRVYATKEGKTDVFVVVGSSSGVTSLKGELRASTSSPTAVKITGEHTSIKYNAAKGLHLVNAGYFMIEDSYGVTSVMKPIYVSASTISLVDITRNKNVIAYVDNNGRLQFKYDDNTTIATNANVEGTITLEGITHNGLTTKIILTIDRN